MVYAQEERLVMDICDGGYDSHDAVVHLLDTSCPLCTVREELRNELDSLREELEDQRKESESLQNDYDELEEKYNAISSIEESIKDAVKDRL